MTFYFHRGSLVHYSPLSKLKRRDQLCNTKPGAHYRPPFFFVGLKSLYAIMLLKKQTTEIIAESRDTLWDAKEK